MNISFKNKKTNIYIDSDSEENIITRTFENKQSEINNQ